VSRRLRCSGCGAPTRSSRIWCALKLSNDPAFEAKFWDLIGLYLDPPEKALVLCCDEKSQCQALERTRPGLPPGVGHIGTKTHDCTRRGTITLFAPSPISTARSSARPHRAHAPPVVGLPQASRCQNPADLTLHLVVDNYATHKHPKVKSWIADCNRRQRKAHDGERIIPHFTSTSSSWMNLVERFFRDLTEDAVHDDSFASVAELCAPSKAISPSATSPPALRLESRWPRYPPQNQPRPRHRSGPIFSIEIYKTSH
jgi:hypothetical protein